MTPQLWALWAFVLILQNFSFTFVSRARNSGSLKKHLVAGIFSNGIWFASQIFAFSAIFSILTGKYGIGKAMAAGAFYTAFTLTGSLLAHQFALKTEKGSSRVGAHKDVATFTQGEAEAIRGIIQENAYWMAAKSYSEDKVEITNSPDGSDRWVPSDVPSVPFPVNVSSLLAAKPGQGAKL